MQQKSVEKAFKKTIAYSYAITQPFMLLSNTAAPLTEQMFVTSENITYGTHSEIVRHIQLKLNKLGYYTDKMDGIYGLYTERSVRQFQSSENLAVNGQVDVTTMQQLLYAEKRQEIGKIVPYLQEITFGEQNQKVTYVQEVLYYYGYYTGKIDGIYGPLTEQAIQQIIEEELVPTDVAHQKKSLHENEQMNHNVVYLPQQKNDHQEMMQLPLKQIDGEVIQIAKKYLGAPYLWGGTTPNGFDCSGFIQYIYSQLDYNIPRTVSEIWNFATPVEDLAIGDLVFFETYQPGPSHVGIYLGNGKFIHCSTSKGVGISNLKTNSYWQERYLGAKRIIFTK